MSKKYYCICKKGFRKYYYFKDHQNLCNTYKKNQENIFSNIEKLSIVFSDKETY